MNIFKKLFGSSDEVTCDIIMDDLDRFSIYESEVTTERAVEKKLAEFLRKHFCTVSTQYKIGGHSGLSVDIDLFDGEFGIEIKLANQLIKNVGNIHRMIGQAVYYDKRLYNGNLIVAIIGNKKNMDEPSIDEAMDFLNEMGIDSIYITTKTRRKKTKK